MKRFLLVLVVGSVFAGALGLSWFLAANYLNGSRVNVVPEGVNGSNYEAGKLVSASETSITIRTTGITGHQETLVNADRTVTVEHLQQHIQYNWPVGVYWKLENGKRTAVQIVDS